MKARPSRPSWLPAILLATGGGLTALILAEIFLRIISPAWLHYRMEEIRCLGAASTFGNDAHWPVEYAEGKIVGFTPGSDFNAQCYDFHHSIHIDDKGGRRMYTPEKARGKMLVPFLGDSMTFGLGVPDEDTYVNLLAQRLPYRFINLAVPGFTLPNELDLLEARHADLGFPQVYVFNFFPNDIAETVWYHSDTLIARDSLPGSWDPLLTWCNHALSHHWFFKRLYLIQFLKIQLLAIYNRKHALPKMDKTFISMVRSAGILEKATGYLDQDLDRLQRLSQELQFRPIFVLIPDRHQVYPALLRMRTAYYRLPNQDVDPLRPLELFRQKLIQRNIPFIDLLEHFKQQGDGLYYLQDHHWTAKGCQAAANGLSSQLEKILAAWFPSSES